MYILGDTELYDFGVFITNIVNSGPDMLIPSSKKQSK